MLMSHQMGVPDGGLYAANPPDGPPTNGSTYYVDEATETIGLQWANGDADAWIQVGYSGSATVDPTSTTTALPPGTTSYETGTTDVIGWYVRHTQGGTPSAWAYCTPHV